MFVKGDTFQYNLGYVWGYKQNHIKLKNWIYLQWACKDAVYSSLYQGESAELGIHLSVNFVHVFLHEPTLIGFLNI